VPGVDDRAAGGEQEPRRLGHILGIARRAIAARRGVGEPGRIDLGHHHVARDLEQHRRARPGAELAERPAQHLRHPLDVIDARGPLRHMAIGRQRVVLPARHAKTVLVRAAGQQQHRDRIGERLGDAAIRVLDPRPRLHRADPQSPPVRRAAEAVGHVQQRLLGARDDRADAERRRRVDDRVVRVGEEVLDLLRLQDTRDRLGTIHRPALHSCVVGGAAPRRCRHQPH